MTLRSILVASIVLIAAFGVGAQVNEPKGAYMLDSFGRVPNGDMRGRLDVLLADLSNQPDARAIIYVHGTAAEIQTRKRLFTNHFAFRRFDVGRIKFVSGLNIGTVRSDFWIVPSGAHEPDVAPEAWIHSEVGRAAKKAFETKVSSFFREGFSRPDHQSYIINYGTPREIKQREKWIANQVSFRKFDRSRITLVNGGPGKVRNVFWFVPPGAKHPVH